MSQTSYLGLELQESADNTLFEDFLEKQFGKGTGTAQSPLSNLQKIDNFAQNENNAKVNVEAITNKYSGESTYAVNDICFYSGDLYRCKVAITTPQHYWTGAANWEKININPVLETVIYNKVVDCGYSGSQSDFFNDLSSLDGLATSLEELL